MASDYFVKPLPRLFQVEKKGSSTTTVGLVGAGQDLSADLGPGVLFLDQFPLAVCLARLGRPVAVHIAKPPVRDDR